jgi:hypothetical protein
VLVHDAAAALLQQSESTNYSHRFETYLSFLYLGETSVTETSATSALVRSVVEALNVRGFTLAFSGSLLLELVLLVALSLDLRAFHFQQNQKPKMKKVARCVERSS